MLKLIDPRRQVDEVNAPEDDIETIPDDELGAGFHGIPAQHPARAGGMRRWVDRADSEEEGDAVFEPDVLPGIEQQLAVGGVDFLAVEN